MLLILQSLTFYLISVINAFLIGLYFYVTQNFKTWQELGDLYVKPGSAVPIIQGRTFRDIVKLQYFVSHRS